MDDGNLHQGRVKMLEIQKYLEGSLLIPVVEAGLKDNFGIKTVRHKKYPNLILFKYSQVDSPMKERIVQECRGIILDENDNWKIISRGPNKFFNVGEHLAAPIDWKTAVVQEKADGSYTCIYYYDDNWHVQTSGTPDASGEVGGLNITFAELFWQVFKEKGYKLPGNNLIGCCFGFELMTKYNQVIVRHSENDLKLIFARSLNLEVETPIWDQFSMAVRDLFNWEVVKSYSIKSLKEMEDSFPDMDPFKQEGYVVVDANFNRVKCKNPKYVAIHHIKEGNSLGRLVEIVQNGEYGEFLSYFPEWRNDIESIEHQVISFIHNLEHEYNAIKEITSQKEFALEACKTKCSSALFQVRAGKVESVRKYINNLAPDKIIDMLGLKYCERSNQDSTISE